MIIDNCEQGSETWFEKRCGSIGASSVSKIITSTGKRSSQRKAYLYQLAGEKITGIKADSYSNANMEEGINREQESRELFEFTHNVEIEEVGLILPFEGADYHCSPDGLVKGEEEGLELKNVLASTQVKYLDKGVLPTEYKLQCQFSLFVTGWDIWHFFSNHPGIKPFYFKVSRDEELIKLIHAEVNIFNRELTTLVEKLKE